MLSRGCRGRLFFRLKVQPIPSYACCSYACDVAIEHAEEHPDAPLRLWDVLHKEIRWESSASGAERMHLQQLWVLRTEMRRSRLPGNHCTDSAVSRSQVPLPTTGPAASQFVISWCPAFMTDPCARSPSCAAAHGPLAPWRACWEARCACTAAPPPGGAKCPPCPSASSPACCAATWAGGRDREGRLGEASALCCWFEFGLGTSQASPLPAAFWQSGSAR